MRFDGERGYFVDRFGVAWSHPTASPFEINREANKLNRQSRHESEDAPAESAQSVDEQNEPEFVGAEDVDESQGVSQKPEKDDAEGDDAEGDETEGDDDK